MQEGNIDRETPTHYSISSLKENGNPNKDYILIDFNKIILDKSMSTTLTQLCGDKYYGSQLKKFKNSTSYTMDRIETVKKGFDEDKSFDHIKVSKFKGLDKYEIIDGRHRYILSLYRGYSHIPCNIV